MSMKNAIIIHGNPSKREYYSDEYPASSNFHWLPWLQKQLLIRDIYAVTPEMQYAFMPDYKIWKKEFERNDITAETILVGHSCGGGFLVRWLSENKEVKVGKVVLVAPWLDPENSIDTDFFNFQIDPNLATRTAGLTVFSSTDDTDDIQKSVIGIINVIPSTELVEFESGGHFTGDTYIRNGFPELLEEILK